jgi:hypothetical protein
MVIAGAKNDGVTKQRRRAQDGIGDIVAPAQSARIRVQAD